jgi:hypothetical protein
VSVLQSLRDVAQAPLQGLRGWVESKHVELGLPGESGSAASAPAGEVDAIPVVALDYAF